MKIKYNKRTEFKEVKDWKIGDKVVALKPHEADKDNFEKYEIRKNEIYTITRMFEGGNSSPFKGMTIINLNEKAAGYISDSFLNITND